MGMDFSLFVWKQSHLIKPQYKFMQTAIKNSLIRAYIRIMQKNGNAAVVVKLGDCNVTSQANSLGAQ